MEIRIVFDLTVAIRIRQHCVLITHEFEWYNLFYMVSNKISIAWKENKWILIEWYVVSAHQMPIFMQFQSTNIGQINAIIKLPNPWKGKKKKLHEIYIQSHHLFYTTTQCQYTYDRQEKKNCVHVSLKNFVLLRFLFYNVSNNID